MQKRRKKATAKAASQEAMPWETVSRSTFSSRIAKQIRAALFARQLSPGQRLGTENVLAKQFGVSRMAARDALRSLQANGVIDIKVGIKGGIFVANANPERYSDALAVQLALMGITPEELLDAQIAIEVTAIGLAAQSATQKDLDVLYEQFEEFKAEMKNLEPTAFSQFAAKVIWLHEGLIDASRNRVLIGQFKALALLLEPIYRGPNSWNAVRDLSTAIRSVITSHAALLECLTARDAEGAQTLTRARLQGVRKISLESLAKFERAARQPGVAKVAQKRM